MLFGFAVVIFEFSHFLADIPAHGYAQVTRKWDAFVSKFTFVVLIVQAFIRGFVEDGAKTIFATPQFVVSRVET